MISTKRMTLFSSHCNCYLHHICSCSVHYKMGHAAKNIKLCSMTWHPPDMPWTQEAPPESSWGPATNQPSSTHCASPLAECAGDSVFKGCTTQPSCPGWQSPQPTPTLWFCPKAGPLVWCQCQSHGVDNRFPGSGARLAATATQPRAQRAVLERSSCPDLSWQAWVHQTSCPEVAVCKVSLLNVTWQCQDKKQTNNQTNNMKRKKKNQTH